MGLAGETAVTLGHYPNAARRASQAHVQGEALAEDSDDIEKASHWLTLTVRPPGDPFLFPRCPNPAGSKTGLYGRSATREKAFDRAEGNEDGDGSAATNLFFFVPDVD
jgi:hypothetical protein